MGHKQMATDHIEIYEIGYDYDYDYVYICTYIRGSRIIVVIWALGRLQRPDSASAICLETSIIYRRWRRLFENELLAGWIVVTRDSLWR